MAGGSIAVDQDRTHLRIPFGRFELSWHSGEKAVEDKLRLDTDDRVVRARHANISNEGRSVRKDPGIRRRNVGVSPEHGGDAAVEVPAERDLFAGGLGMDVEKYNLGCDLAEKFVGFAEGIIAGRHEDASLKIHDCVRLSVRKLTLVKAKAGCADRIVGRAEDAAAAFVRIGRHGHVFEDLALVPNMVPRGDDMGAHIEDLFSNRGGNAEATGSVLAIDDEEVDRIGLENVWKVLAYDVATGRAEDVADEKDVHLRILHGRGAEDATPPAVVACLRGKQ